MSDLIPSNGSKVPASSFEWSHPGLNPDPVSTEKPKDELDLRQVLGVIRRNWILIAVCGIAAIGIAIYSIMNAAPQYKATATIRISDQTQAITGTIQSQSAFNDILGK